MQEYLEKQSDRNRKQEKTLTPNNTGTGIPFQMKTEFEDKTKLSYEDVRVHYNSPKPAALHAFAYTQGEDVYLGPSQEKYLPHELMHVAQQKKGLVKPTGHIGACAYNDDPALEQKADTVTDAGNPNREAESVLMQPVIQRKQTVPLWLRLKEQEIDARGFGYTIAGLMEAYDRLANEEATREDQIMYLRLIMDGLSRQKMKKRYEHEFEKTMRILQDEFSFVQVQNYDGLFHEAEAPWQHMDDSPFLRVVAQIARDDDIKGIPSNSRFSALKVIKALSSHHIRQLSPPAKKSLPSSDEGGPAFESVFRAVLGRIMAEGVLSHYSHRPNLPVLHSTNYLKANKILSKERLAKSVEVGKSENVSKSQDVDVDIIKNTGFVFFFLEQGGSAHRRGGGFGKYRYTVKLASGISILSDAWAILHDIAGTQNENRAILSGSEIHRKIDTDFDPNNILKMSEDPKYLKIVENLKAESRYPSTVLSSVLSMFLPTADQTFSLQTPHGENKTVVVDHISGNFLYGEEIVTGVASRAAHELMTLRAVNPEVYEQIMEGEKFWEFLSGIVHDLQIMVPRDVLTEQPDFAPADETEIIVNETDIIADEAETAGLRHFHGELPESIILKSENNCFFEAMLPHMKWIMRSSASRLRNEFVAYQKKTMITPLPEGVPVEFEHIQQFADFAHIAITVVTHAPQGELILIDFPSAGAAKHIYIRYLPPGPDNPEGIGHFTNL